MFGFGFLSWAPDGQSVQRHLVTAQVSISFDTERGMLTVTPAGEGARPTLEQDMLEPQHRPDPLEQRSIEDTLETFGESVWEPGPLDHLLKSWVHSVSAEGQYGSALERPKRPGPAPVVHLAPALILRRRTERSFIRVFQEIIDQLEAGQPIPEGVRGIINAYEDPEPGSSTRDDNNGGRAAETYFPLPANEAQQEIVRRLNANQGVLVQGPPGTGKSHTIVNLICHALATGQRVLVTSHAVRALKVLRRMIRERVPDLAPLSVVLLGDDREALLAMEESVHGITTRQNTWTAQESQVAISRLEHELDRERRCESKVLTDLRAIREQETEHDEKFGYAGTLARIADALYRERESLSWIHDSMPEEVDPPLSAAEFAELLSLVRNERVTRWEAGGRASINLDALPPIEAFEKAVWVEREARGDYEDSATIRQRREYRPLAAMDEQDRRALAEGLQKLAGLIQQIERRPLDWTETAMKQILGDFERTWRQLLQDTSETAKSLAASTKWLDANPITPQPSLELQTVRGDASDLLGHLEADGGWGFGPFRSVVVKRALYIRDLRIGGRPCKTVDAVSDLRRRLDAEIEVRRLRERWAPHHDLSATTVTALVAELQDICEPIGDAFDVLEIKDELSAILGRTPGNPVPDWSDSASLHRMNEILTAINVVLRYEAARVQFEQSLQSLGAQQRRGGLDSVSEQIRVAIEERDVRAYAVARQRAEENAKLTALLNRKRELLDRLTARAPKLAREITETSADGVWDVRPRDFEQAWNWSRAKAWLTRLAEPGSEHQHRLELDDTKRRIARTVELIAAEKAWTHCFNRMTENERQHLVAWSKAVRAIGKGTGKYASLHRRNARAHLNASRSAIPAWVMPLHRVAETIKPGSELFDIAIIDEASQSGPEALLLAWLAKKLVVVGDDKQIHPTYAGVDFDDVNQLRARYIAELPHADSYGVNHSFFDLTEIRYKSRIRLREHFRCMPEIIQFSNNLSYSGEPLIPLRQYGAGRLEPTVATRRVPDGYQKGTGARSVNPPEAEAIVDEIVRICDVAAYSEKTIGVISLLGDAQARDIETRLIRKLGPEETERRQIVCGDAYAFQGDERDIMFLSMVSAPQENRSIRAMTDAAAQRRFNVAASRARDQLYLFHTATLADLSPHCMRHQLLKYCLDPHVAIPDVAGLDLPALERSAFQADRQRVKAPFPFESWFEVDVFLHIGRREYRVIPQFEVGGYRIDLLVQGMDASLAVECDGDAWHGADRYETDAARQRDLERCGWTFWRVRESVFRLDPDEALSDLWETLKRKRVFPKSTEKTRFPETGSVAQQPLAVDSGGNEREVGESADHLPLKSVDPVPANQTAGSKNLSRFSEQSGVPERLTRDGIVPSPRVGQLPRSIPIPANANGVMELEPYLEWKPTSHVHDPRTASQIELTALLAELPRSIPIP